MTLIMEGSLHKAGSGMNFRNARRLRKDATDAEDFLWQVIRGKKFCGYKFRRQHPIDVYIADFYCHELKLMIELDGGYHNTEAQKEKDFIRDQTFLEKGTYCLRLPNELILHDPENCINLILSTINQLKQDKHLP